MSEEGSLETPLVVNMAAGAVALAAAFMCIMAAQFVLSDAYGTAFIFTVIYGLVGGLGFVMAAFLAKGKGWAAIGGVVVCLVMLGLFWTPILFGVLAFSALGTGFCAFLGLILAAVSIPICLRLTREREKFFEEIDAG